MELSNFKFKITDQTIELNDFTLTSFRVKFIGTLFSRRKLWIRCICEEDQYRNFKSDLYIIKVEKEKNDDAFNLKEEIEMLKYLNNNRNAYPIMGFDYEFKSLNKVEKNEKRG